MRHINGRIVIGLTGGVGSGKSTVANILKDEFGALLILTDDVAKELMKPNRVTYNKVVNYFGEGILNKDRSINAQMLSNIVFNDENELKKLNEISHGDVLEKIEILLRDDTLNKIIVIESAILVESGCNKFCDQIWSVITDNNIRKKRLEESRGYSEEKTNQVMNNQKSNEWYINISDKYIVNDGDINNLKEKVSQYVSELWGIVL